MDLVVNVTMSSGKDPKFGKKVNVVKLSGPNGTSSFRYSISENFEAGIKELLQAVVIAA